VKTERQFILPKEPENSCGALYESGKSRGRYNSSVYSEFLSFGLPGVTFYSLFSQRKFAKNFQKSGREGIEESRDMPQVAQESLYSDPTSPKYKRTRFTPGKHIIKPTDQYHNSIHDWCSAIVDNSNRATGKNGYSNTQLNCHDT